MSVWDGSKSLTEKPTLRRSRCCVAPASLRDRDCNASACGTVLKGSNLIAIHAGCHSAFAISIGRRSASSHEGRPCEVSYIVHPGSTARASCANIPMHHEKYTEPRPRALVTSAKRPHRQLRDRGDCADSVPIHQGVTTEHVHLPQQGSWIRVLIMTPMSRSRSPLG